MTFAILFWIAIVIGVLVASYGVLCMRYGTSPQAPVFGIIALIFGVAVIGLALLATASGASASTERPSFIEAMESAFGMHPGARKPVMQCQCSIEYLGTKAQGGNVYAVLIKKLD
jgi:hypothetical protein